MLPDDLVQAAKILDLELEYINLPGVGKVKPSVNALAIAGIYFAINGLVPLVVDQVSRDRIKAALDDFLSAGMACKKEDAQG
jgi:hypothetical protein